MSKQTVEWVTGKIGLDAGFRDALIADPDQALSGLDLNESEKAWLKHIDFETMEALAQILASRVGKINPESQSPPIRLFKYGEDESWKS